MLEEDFELQWSSPCQTTNFYKTDTGILNAALINCRGPMSDPKSVRRQSTEIRLTEVDLCVSISCNSQYRIHKNGRL